MSNWKLTTTTIAVILLQGCAAMERNLAARREQQAQQREAAQERYMQSLRDICANSPGPGVFQNCMKRQHEENIAAQQARNQQAAVAQQTSRQRRQEADRALLRSLQPAPSIDCTSSVSGSTVSTHCTSNTSTGTEVYDLLMK